MFTAYIILWQATESPNFEQQECIPLGCEMPASMAFSRGVCPGCVCVSSGGCVCVREGVGLGVYTYTPWTQRQNPQTQRQTPLLNRMTDRCKNITFPKLSLRPVNIAIVYLAFPGVCACVCTHDRFQHFGKQIDLHNSRVSNMIKKV